MSKTKPPMRIRAKFLAFITLFLITYSNYSQGPTSPEAASFEPVDAADMVNLVTGDLSYVLPLLNVPSPEGGYPIVLSYHAGINMEQEASWVGMGWNVNPGAINRNVNGHPDDWNNKHSATLVYDSGGLYTTHNFFAGVGWGEDGHYSVGFYASHGINKSFSGSTTYNNAFGVSAQINSHGINIGTNGVGYSYDAYSKKGNIGTVSIGFNKYDGVYGGFAENTTGLGITLSSQGNTYLQTSKNNVQISGGTPSSKLHTRIAGLTFLADVNVGPVKLTYSRKKLRYWWFDRKSHENVGVLYAGQMDEVINNSVDPNYVSFDFYESLYKHDTNLQLMENNFVAPAYDNYTVTSQGLSGDISPKLFEHGAFKGKNIIINSDSEGYRTHSRASIYDNSFVNQVNSNQNDVNFYFENINASYINIKSGIWNQPPSQLNSITAIVPSSKTIETSVNINGQTLSNYNLTNKRITNGPFIEVFTNNEILANPGLINDNTLDRSQLPPDGIGAYKITKSDGITYHYSLPVYQKEKFVKSTEIDKDIEHKFYEEQQLEPYATHWLLTSITGPDYLDDGDHKYDEDDLGYWIEFDYGKWSDGYVWRSPRTGYQETSITKSFSWGIKEIYYLDKIRTRTHTALFVKEERLDNTGSGSELNIGTSKESPKVYNYGVKAVLGLDNNTGSYVVHGIYDSHIVSLATGVYYSNIFHNEFVKINKEHKVLKLKEIFLLKNEDVPENIKSNSNQSTGVSIGEIYHSEEFEVFDTAGRRVYSRTGSNAIIHSNNRIWKGEYFQNVIDIEDINQNFPNIHSKKLDHSEFIYNYSLMKNSSNSNDINGGRLTLEKVMNYGRSTQVVLPPYKFSYTKNFNYNRDQEDDWGYYKNNPQAWSLNKIINPLGSSLNIVYEADDYHQEAATPLRNFNEGLKFTFYKVSDKLRFEITKDDDTYLENDLDFRDYFEVGNTSFIDLWLCWRYDYRDWDCKSRQAVIDINEDTQIVNVTETTVTFETPLSNTENHSGGLDWLIDRTPISLENHPNMILVKELRGKCANPPGCDNVTPRLVFQYNILSKDKKRDVKGGGIRVKEISVNGNNNEETLTHYYYNDLNFNSDPGDQNYRSSGITSYAPSKYPKVVEHISELPYPTVMYKNVTEVNNSTIQEYEFDVIEPLIRTNNELSMGDKLSIKLLQEDNANTTYTVDGDEAKISRYKYEKTENFSAIGRLKSLTVKNKYQQVKMITKNQYKSPQQIKQGLIGESFSNYSLVRNYGDLTYNLNISSSIKVPSVLLSTETIQNGKNNTVYFDSYDFNIGQLLESRTTNSKDQEIKTEIIPAYKRYPGMGSKVDDPTNKNMLTQEAVTYSYLKDNNTWKITGVGISTWKYNWENTSSAWRKHKTFAWNGQKDTNGFFTNYTKTATNDDGFNWANTTVEDHGVWRFLFETSKYNNFSAPTEVVDINKNRASTKYDSKHEKILVTANAPYNAMFYSGAEDNLVSGNFGGNVNKGSGSSLNNVAHTGKNSLQISSGQEAFKVVPGTTGKYKISVWVHGSAYTNTRINNGTDVTYNNDEVVIAGDWVQLNFYTEVNQLSITTPIYIKTISGKIIVDDFRMHPVSSSMTAYVYNEWDELECIIGANNMATKYEYDKAGRLEKVYQEVQDTPALNGGFKKVAEHNYNYKISQ